MGETQEKDYWKAINRLLEGKIPLVNLPHTMNNEGWIQKLVADIMKQTADSITAGRGAAAAAGGQAGGSQAGGGAGGGQGGEGQAGGAGGGGQSGGGQSGGGQSGAPRVVRDAVGANQPDGAREPRSYREDPDFATTRYRRNSRPYTPGQKVENPRVTQTAKSVTVRYRIPYRTDPDSIRLYADRRHLRLQGLAGGRSRSIPLPVAVREKGAKAQLTGDLLTVRLPRAEPRRETEIFIRYL